MIEETLFQHFLQDFIYEINYDVCSPKRTRISILTRWKYRNWFLIFNQQQMRIYIMCHLAYKKLQLTLFLDVFLNVTFPRRSTLEIDIMHYMVLLIDISMVLLTS